jgi:hypothetical protein
LEADFVMKTSEEIVPNADLIVDNQLPVKTADKGKNEENKVSVEPPAAHFKTKLRKSLESLIESSPWSTMMTFVTIWTLFQGDIKYAGTGKEADSAFEVIISIFFFLFVFEIIAQSIYKEGYFLIPKWEAEAGETSWQTWKRRIEFGSFYFWMDVIATGTLILDMKWIIGSVGIKAINGGGSQSAKGSAAAKTGSRLGRLVRLVRMVRLTRLAKLYKYAMAAITGNKIEIVEEDAESKVGAAMTELTNRRLALLCVFLHFYELFASFSLFAEY